MRSTLATQQACTAREAREVDANLAGERLYTAAACQAGGVARVALWLCEGSSRTV